MLKNIITRNQNVEIKVALEYPGNVFVKEGEFIAPETTIARTELISLQPGFFNVVKEFNIPKDQIREAIKCEVGQDVSVGEVLASYQGVDLIAPYNGWVEYISFSNGYILIRQRVVENEKPYVIDIAGELKIRKSLVPQLATVKVGKNVVRGQTIAGEMHTSIMSMHARRSAAKNSKDENDNIVKAPIAGVVTEISKAEGTISIKPYYQPTEKKAGMYGVVREVIPDYGVIISTTADVITGAFGVGGDVTGKLVFADNVTEEAVIRVVDGQVTADIIRNCINNNTVGIIAASVDADVICDIYGMDIADGVTGGETAKCSLIVLNGFGKGKLSENLNSLFSQYEGSSITIKPATNVQTPVVKPKIYLYHQV